MTEPQMPQKSPYIQDAEPGNYAWCACGKSAKQPFCDGSHAGMGIGPVVVKLEEKKKVAWCGCKQSQNKPYCDGSHSKL